MTQSGGFSAHRMARVHDVMRGTVERGEVAGLVALAARGDDVHVEAIGVQDLDSGNPMRRDTIFRIASMTKPITAAAAMILVEEGRMKRDDAVERWLPELADRRVLRSIDSAIDDTVPAHRPITLDDLLTFRLGLGAVMAPPGRYPVQSAMAELGVAPGPSQLPFGPDEFMARIGRLPLIHQPGERWMYHTGADILAVLIARITARPLEDFLRERIFAPLGMKDTGFSVPEGSLERFATCYAYAESGGLTVWDPARGGQYARPRAFPSLLVSTADDYLAFARMLLSCGQYKGGRILAAETVTLMMTDHITQAQKDASPFAPSFWDQQGWGFGGAVVTKRAAATGPSPGSYGWAGGFSTNFLIDPGRGMTTISLIQRLMRGPDDAEIGETFRTLVYEATEA